VRIVLASGGRTITGVVTDATGGVIGVAETSGDDSLSPPELLAVTM